MATRDDPFRTRATDIATWVLLPVGVITVSVAFVALIVGAVAGSGAFPASDPVNAARDTGVLTATTSWATPLALLGVGTIFAAAIPAALARIRTSIGGRRDALATALPRLVGPSAGRG